VDDEVENATLAWTVVLVLFSTLAVAAVLFSTLAVAVVLLALPQSISQHVCKHTALLLPIQQNDSLRIQY
jgi:hypothetical protein